MKTIDVAVIGAGPGGLAAAASLRALGVPSLIVERNDQVASSWRGHYDRLHLHTTRGLSGLPGLPIPRSCGQWVSRDDLIRYLEQYAQHHQLTIQTGTRVDSLSPEAGGGWRLGTSRGELSARSVIVATGYSHTPWQPNWPGRFTGELLHASQYKNPAPYRGKDVLVVGTGNTGAEIAVDLVEGGAARVTLSARTPPNIVPRAVAGVPTQVLGIALRSLSPKVVDPLVAGFARLTVGDLTRYGVPKAPRGMYTQVLRDGVLPILDVGIVAAIKAEKVKVVPGVEAFDGAEVLLAGGQRLRPDAVIAATGYRRGLESLCGALGVLDDKGCPRVHGGATDPSAPDLYFIGFSNPVSGNLREMAKDSRTIARAIQRRHAATRPAFEHESPTAAAG